MEQPRHFAVAAVAVALALQGCGEWEGHMDSRARSSDCDNLFVKPLIDHYCRGGIAWHTTHLIDDELRGAEGDRASSKAPASDVARVLGAMLCHKDFIRDLQSECAQQCGDKLRIEEKDEHKEPDVKAELDRTECLDVMFTGLTRDHFHKYAQMKGVTDITQQSIQEHAQAVLAQPPRIDERLGDPDLDDQTIFEQSLGPVVPPSARRAVQTARAEDTADRTSTLEEASQNWQRVGGRAQAARTQAGRKPPAHNQARAQMARARSDLDLTRDIPVVPRPAVARRTSSPAAFWDAGSWEPPQGRPDMRRTKSEPEQRTTRRERRDALRLQTNPEEKRKNPNDAPRAFDA